ncbi:MAG: SDR family oxidoreductase, partial [Deltaproteobacteria bacterium]|nr:SDR family oxidoreductase [Deltaproteobacteria bacterium]
RLLCRPRKGLSALERVERLLRWFGMEGETDGRLRVVEGELDRPGFGLSDGDYRCLVEEVDEVFHCAADTSFSPRERERIEATNIGGVRHLLAFAIGGKCAFFHHMSTAYVAGERAGECREEILAPNRFHNAYEETKCRAEGLVRDCCIQGGIPWNIYRPSVVYGDSATGKSIRFNGLYYPIKTILFLKKIFERDILEKGGTRARQMGVRLDNGCLFMDIRVEKRKEGRINLIPIDFLVEACMAIMEESTGGGIFHIVSRNPCRLDDLIRYTRDLFHIRGIRAACGDAFAGAPRSALEILFDGYLDTYHPYLLDTRIFSSEKADVILRKRDISCPDLDFAVFSRIMNYALDVDWGKRVFDAA